MKLRNLSYVIIIGLVGGFALMASTGGTKRAVKKEIIIKKSINDLSFEEQLTEPPTGGKIWHGDASGFISRFVGDTIMAFATWQGTVWMLAYSPDPRLDPDATDSINGDWEDPVHNAHGKFWGYLEADGTVKVGFWWSDNLTPPVDGSWEGRFIYAKDTMNGTWICNTYQGDGTMRGSR